MPRHRASLSRGRARRRRARIPADGCVGGAGAGALARSADARGCWVARRRGGRGRLDRRQHAAGAESPPRLPTDVRGPAGRRRARWARYRHRGLPDGRRQDLRHRAATGASLAPVHRAPGPVGGRHIRCRAGGYRAPRRPRCQPRERAHAPRPRRRLARDLGLGYRGGVRSRCRIDQEEDRPIGTPKGCPKFYRRA